MDNNHMENQLFFTMDGLTWNGEKIQLMDSIVWDAQSGKDFISHWAATRWALDAKVQSYQ